jgi:hypothetical protein
MIRRILFTATVALVASASQASAAPTIGVRCGANEDRVWVYESLVDFNVEAKLKCGDQVEVLDRVKGYVKVRTPSGDEGFIADTAFPKSAIPPEPEDKSHDLEAQSQKILASSKARTAATDSASISSSAATAAPAAAARPAPPTVSVAAKPVVLQPSPAPAPTVAVSAPVPAPVATPAPAPAPRPKVVAVRAPAPPTVSAPAPAPAPVAQKPVVLAAAPTPTPAVTAASAPTAPTPAAVAVSTPAPAPAPAPAPTPTVVAVSAPAPAPTPARAIDPDADEVESTVDTSMANCSTYFAAYGLSPNQFKWIEQNRKKAFPSVCPAPTPAMVDFVVIFTHDVDFYSVTMPTAVHHEQNGFSDWAPLSTVDNALMSPSDANKSHHEYVWVFHSRRGAYDPAAFSAHRKPIFSKGETNTLGSHGGFRTVMDALTYIETNGAPR